MRVLVTGAQGFAGRFLAEALRARGAEVIPTGRRSAGQGDLAGLRTVDLGEPEAVHALVSETKPDAICHLAGMTYLPAVLAEPEASFVANVLSAGHLLQAAAEHARSARILLVSSCTVYGAPAAEALPVAEDAPLLAMHPYGVQKIGAEVLGRRARERLGLDVVIARPFNHTGPGQDPRISVIHFARQIARAEARGEPAVLGVGDLRPKRDFLDVLDVVDAYLALLDHPQPPRCVNVCSGRSVAIGEILGHLKALAQLPVDVREDPVRMRPNDVMDLRGNPERLMSATGWRPRIDLRDTLRRVLDHERRLAIPS